MTDPKAIAKIDSFQVDARTVNDVKVSEDGRVAVISREGASNRRHGIVILDVSDPRNVTEISRQSRANAIRSVWLPSSTLLPPTIPRISGRKLSRPKGRMITDSRQRKAGLLPCS